MWNLVEEANNEITMNGGEIEEHDKGVRCTLTRVTVDCITDSVISCTCDYVGSGPSLCFCKLEMLVG